MTALARLPFHDLGFARVDHHRHLRTGFPEVVLCQGKQPAQIVGVLQELMRTGANVLGTRASAEQADFVRAALPEVDYLPLPRLLVARQRPIERRGRGEVIIACAGTADLPVAEEAAVTAELMGSPVARLFDVGVAGLHRLIGHLDELRRAAVIVVVAGMEGALPSVVAGLSGRPVIAVPTSVGYGASFGGLAALLAMLNACAPGVAVVNIDNGFGAATIASRINRLAAAR